MRVITYIFNTIIICTNLVLANAPVENTQLMTKEWTLSLESFGILGVGSVYRLGNGDIFILSSLNSNDWPSGVKVSVFDDSGNLIMQDTLANGIKHQCLGYLDNSTFGVLSDHTNGDGSTSRQARFYSAKNSIYEFIDLPYGAGNEQNASLSLTVNDPSVYYFISNTNQSYYLHKYKTEISGLSENIISGHVSSGFNQDNYVLNWKSGLGIQYQIQSSTNLIDWTPVGQVLTGTGYPMTWANHVTNSQAFYRVVED